MLYKIKVKTESKIQKIIKKKNDEFLVFLKSRARQGIANKELVGLLGRYFNTPVFKIKIIKGVKTQNKIAEIK